eukprot:607150_1
MVSVFGKADSTWNDDSERTFSRDPVHSSKRRLSISSHMKTMSMNTAQISPEPLKHPRRKLSDTVQTPPPKRRKLSEFEARWSEEDGDDDINHVVHRIDPSEDEQKATSASPQSIKHSSNHKQKRSVTYVTMSPQVEVTFEVENCDFMPYKYLLNEHMKRCHQTTAEMSLTTEQLQQHNDRLKADMKREFKGEVLCDKPPSSNKNTNDKGKRATKERAAAKYSCE